MTLFIAGLITGVTTTVITITVVVTRSVYSALQKSVGKDTDLVVKPAATDKVKPVMVFDMWMN